jgi:hypothetical protein
VSWHVPPEALTSQQLGETESTFRDANEGINAAARAFEFDGLIPFVCECGLLACTEVVALSRDEYEAVRASPVTFLVVPGHEIVRDGVGRLEREHERFNVVAKLGRGAEVAIDLDPRA